MEIHEISSQYWSHFANQKSQNKHKNAMLSLIYCWTFKMFPIACYDTHATKSPHPGVGRMGMRREEVRGKDMHFWV